MRKNMVHLLKWVYRTVAVVALVGGGCVDRGTIPVSYDSLLDKEYLYCTAFLRTYLLDTTLLPPQGKVFASTDSLYQYVGDPFTRYIPAKKSAEYRDESICYSKLDKSGMVLSFVPAGVVVVDTIARSPVSGSGVRIGDTLVAVNDTAITGTPENLLPYFNRPASTPLIVTVKRGAVLSKFGFTLKKYRTRTVWYHALDTTTAYVLIPKLCTYSVADSGTRAEFLEMVKQCDSMKRTIIIDLRTTGIGDVTHALVMARAFARPSQVLVRMRERIVLPGVTGAVVVDTVVRSTAQDSGYAVLRKKVYLLVNSQTTHAAEILVTALKEARTDITIVGSLTQGYTCAQKVTQTVDSGYACVTNTEYSTASGMAVTGIGITPSVTIGEDKNALLETLRLIDPLWNDSLLGGAYRAIVEYVDRNITR